MIFEFLLPIIGWLVLFTVFFVIYSNVVYKEATPRAHVEGQGLFTVLATFFWITVYMCLSSIWSILYSLIDLKYPDVVGAVSDYGTSGFSGSGVVYDAFAFPLAMTVVSSVTALCLAFYLINKFQSNDALRPERLYLFLRALVFIGGAVMAFSGFVYVVYSWLYGNLPIAVFLKGFVAASIVGMTALYFYLVADGKNKNEGMISKAFAALIVVATLVTLYVSFQVIGTPAEARKYRLDSITLQNVQNVKYHIDSQAQSFATKYNSLSEITDQYTKNYIKKTPMTYTNKGEKYELCANFISNMPQTINWENRDTSWDYSVGNKCFEFEFPKPYANVNIDPNIPKPIYNQ